MSSYSTICDAIAKKRLIQFTYKDRMRVVEPFMVAQNDAEHYALSAWFVRGASESHSPPGWREYLLSDITDVIILDESFSGQRPGYKPSGGEVFHHVVCRI